MASAGWLNALTNLFFVAHTLFAIIVSANFTILLLVAAVVASYAQFLRLLKDFLL